MSKITTPSKNQKNAIVVAKFNPKEAKGRIANRFDLLIYQFDTMKDECKKFTKHYN